MQLHVHLRLVLSKSFRPDTNGGGLMATRGKKFVRCAASVALAVAVSGGALVLGGCSSCSSASVQGSDSTQRAQCQAQQGDEQSSDSQTSPDATRQVDDDANVGSVVQVGDDSASDTSIEVSNETGYEIASIALRASGDTNYAEGLTFNGLNIVNGQTAHISFNKIVRDGTPVTSYDVKALTPNQGIMEFRNVDLLNLHNLCLKFDEGVGYVSYTDASSGQTADTKDESVQLQKDEAGNISTYDKQNQLG